jgi:hypothetical protein
MTLFIACLLLAAGNYAWGWYIVAFVIWWLHLAATQR